MCVVACAHAADIDLKLGFIRVESDLAAGGLIGELIAGTEQCPITARVTITFFGGRLTALPIGVDSTNSNHGEKGLSVWPNSKISLSGM